MQQNILCCCFPFGNGWIHSITYMAICCTRSKEPKATTFGRKKEVRVVYENPKRKRRNDICATLSTCKERFKNRIRIQLNCNLLTYLLSTTYNQDYICIVNTLIKLVAIIIPLCHGEIAPVNLSVKKGNRIKYSTMFFHHPPTKRRTCSPQRLYVPLVCVS